MFLSTTKSLICSVLLMMDLAFRRQKFSEFADEEFNEMSRITAPAGSLVTVEC